MRLPRATVSVLSDGPEIGRMEGVEVARTVVARSAGLLGRASLGAGEGLWIEPCSGVHTAFMRIPIDVAFVARDGSVLRVAHLAPWRMAGPVRGARAVLETAAGECARRGIAPGARLLLQPR